MRNTSPLMKRRLFEQAVRDVTAAAAAADGPASGSRDTMAAYTGSRREKQRFEYNENSRAAFVELHPLFYPTPEEFKKRLAGVPGVKSVEDGIIEDAFLDCAVFKL